MAKDPKDDEISKLKEENKKLKDDADKAKKSLVVAIAEARVGAFEEAAQKLLSRQSPVAFGLSLNDCVRLIREMAGR